MNFPSAVMSYSDVKYIESDQKRFNITETLNDLSF